MMEFPKTLAAARKNDRDSWALADALLEELGPPTKGGRGIRQSDRFAVCATELKDAGLDYSVKTLVEYRNVAHAFKPETRVLGLTITVAKAAGTPEVYAKAQELATGRGQKVVGRTLVKAVKKEATKHARKKSGKKQPTRGAKAAANARPASETERALKVLKLEELVGKASGMASELIRQYGDASPTDEERDDLLIDIDKLVAHWTAAREVVAGEFIGEVEAFLAS